MTEAVRLIIWDLDETFWKGTLTEGGIDEDQHFGEVVKELARRGIVSSICSKNDFNAAKDVLERLGIWEYFVFPSINWDTKGPRIREIVEQAQLRAPTILFVDDNPMNLEEAKFMVPDLQVADESILPGLLENPLFKGKPDPDMKRLADYKILEVKNAAKQTIGGNAFDFLRESDITVELNYDVEGNIDRAVELLNRTNQLNYTKNRVSDDIETARQQVRDMIRSYNVHTALVHVRDRFGDYGYVGFFVHVRGAGYNKLEQYCFSCRTLGMFVELWLYRQLGRPEIHIKGEVISDLFDESNPADWISFYNEEKDTATRESAGRGGILLCGGCDLEAVAHYLQPVTERFRLFANTIRHGGELRRDHSTIVAQSARPVPAAQRECLLNCGYTDEDLSLDYASPHYSLIIFSFWGDLYYRTYAQHDGQTVLTYTPSNLGYNDLTTFYEADLRNRGVPEEGIQAFRYFRANMVYQGPSDEPFFRKNLREILTAIPADTQVILLLSSENPASMPSEILERHQSMNRWTKTEQKNFPNVSVIPIDDFVENPDEQTTSTHFTRIVYQRLALRLKQVYRYLERNHPVPEQQVSA
ncbi:HAD-IIIC family phosphatase [Gluconobacter sphaericus]|uniref:HAD-IIIC family phosphatase n=1 Tax=Gluconobacter sphaericus TaxID=574987 RepID=UPI001920A2A0|nr:HAD-IIIC family phosphatase [Gluconobacter sphaericus]QQX92078.1 HAD-IIIC family phosphatase [Gluconobacter sphaericus]